MRDLVSTVRPAISVAVIMIRSPASTIARLRGFMIRTSLPGSEKEETDHDRDCDQYANSNDHIVHAVRPQMLQSHPYSEKVS
jgi:hypothetical protein